MLSIARLIKRRSSEFPSPSASAASEAADRAKKVTLKELMDERGLSISRLIKKRALDFQMSPILLWQTRMGKRGGLDLWANWWKTLMGKRSRSLGPNFFSWKTRVGKRSVDQKPCIYQEGLICDHPEKRDVAKPDFTDLWKTRLGKKTNNLPSGFSTLSLWKTRLG